MLRWPLCLALLAAPAGDWPQLLGPNRDGVAVDEAPLTALPATPDVLWEMPVGEGFAGPAVVGDRVFVFHRVGDTLRLEACDAATGTQLWAADAPDNYGEPGFIRDRGPRATPTVTDPALLNEDAGRVLALGAGGLLRCVAANDGREFWRRDLATEFAADLGYFGLGSAPLVVPDLDGGAVVLCVPGGFRREAGVVGLDLATGETRWTAARAKPCYGSPVLTTVGGEPLAVVPTRVTLYGLNPLTGEIGWEVPFGAQGPTAIGANPVLLPGGDGDARRVFLSSNYSTGDVLLTATADAADVTYNGDFVLATHYATPVAFSGTPGDGLLYGISGQENHGPAAFVCVDPVTKETLWRKSGVGYGTLLGVPGGERGAGSVLKLGLDGELILFAADPARYRELARLRLFPPSARGAETRASPAYSGGVLFARDAATLKAVRLR